MLWCVAFFNYADRQAISSVFPLLEREMHLTTVQLGLLGSGFAWVYGLGAPFAGVIVDRIRRKTAIIGGLHAWSVICMTTGLVSSFPSLFLLRAARVHHRHLPSPRGACRPRRGRAAHPASFRSLSDFRRSEERSGGAGTESSS